MYLPLVSLLLCCVAAETALATDDPFDQTDGLYVGHEIGKPVERVTIELRGSSLVILDRYAIGAMAIDRWELAGPGGKGGDLQWKARGTPKLAASRAGKTKRPPKYDALVRLRLWPTRNEAVVCISEPASKLKEIARVPGPEATEAPPAGVSCYALKQVWSPSQVLVSPVIDAVPDFECMRECRQANMMRAVAPEVIDADCRAACTQ